jgi:ParB/RepB/Spo0J family partition protein
MSNAIVVKVPLSDIDVSHGFNSRIIETDKDGKVSESKTGKEDASEREADIQKLMLSLQEHGQLTPVLVRKVDKPGKGIKPYQLIAGFRRYTCITGLSANEKTAARWKDGIEARVLEVTEKEAAYLNLLENEDRKDISAYELAMASKRIKDKYGETTTAIAARLRKSQGYVSNLINNIELLHPTILESWKKGGKATSTDLLNKYRLAPDKEAQLVEFNKKLGLSTPGATPGGSANGANGGTAVPGATPDGKPKFRKGKEIEAAIAYFAEDSGLDVEVVEAIKDTLLWASGKSDKLLGFDVKAYMDAQESESKASKEAFAAFMKGKEAELLKEFEKSKGKA